MDIIRRDYPDLPQPGGAFHHLVRRGNLLFIAGSTASGIPAETGDKPASSRPQCGHSGLRAIAKRHESAKFNTAKFNTNGG